MKNAVTSMLALSLALLSSLAWGQNKETPKLPNQIFIKLAGFEHVKGKVMCSLHTEADWLDKPYKRAVAKITADKKAECMFAQVPPGVYAIAVYHDENSNDELDSNFIGIPNEGIAISNMKKMGMGKPSFEDAKFKYTSGTYTLAAPVLY